MSRHGAKHHRTQKGKKVRVRLKDGTVIVGRFEEPNHKHCLLSGLRRIPWSDVESFSIWGPPRVRKSR